MTLAAKQVVAPRVLTDRVTVDHMTANGRHIVAGQELSVDGIRGRVTFVAYTRHESDAEWVDVIVDKTGRSRTVRPAAIRTVHRKVVAR